MRKQYIIYVKTLYGKQPIDWLYANTVRHVMEYGLQYAHFDSYAEVSNRNREDLEEAKEFQRKNRDAIGGRTL